MDKPLQLLCDTLKNIAAKITPQESFSFIIMTGKVNQGKTALLRQSSLQHFPVDTDNGANFFYNDQGIILELCERWLNQSDSLLAYTLKELNRCHAAISISGILLCIDSRELLQSEVLHLGELCQSHTQLLTRFEQALAYPVDVGVLVTKLDAVAGFCEFFQSESEGFSKPLGFSLEFGARSKLLASYQWQFDEMIEMLGQQIIKKLHPARSGAKRTLIREFPLQLASLKLPLKSLLKALSRSPLSVRAIYFASAEQGGVSIDRLNKKIQHEYALSIQEKIPQSHNYRPFFIDAALLAFQQQTQVSAKKANLIQKSGITATLSLAGLILISLVYHHVQTASLLDETSRELLNYETLVRVQDNASALYHLSLAEAKMGLVPRGLWSVGRVNELGQEIQKSTNNKLQTNFLPDMIGHLEETMTNPSETPLARYRALKVYLMWAEPAHFERAEVMAWFQDYWKKRRSLNDQPLLLLESVLKHPLQVVPVNKQLVLDVRNYLNALPAAYLFYTLAKGSFSEQTLKLSVDGFDLPTTDLPIYFTRKGFQQTLGLLPKISQTLKAENWVLARQDLNDLAAQLEEAYAYEYVSWWQNFMKAIRPHHYQGYQEGRLLIQKLLQTDAFTKLVALAQRHTKPGLGKEDAEFNQRIATQFTNLNLMSTKAVHELSESMVELEKFISTLSVLKDRGETVFAITKARFQGEAQGDPLSVFYKQASQLPEPVSTWAKLLADDTWFVFIKESRDYINDEWQKNVYRFYTRSIAKHYPIDANQLDEISRQDFDSFFSPGGILDAFVTANLKPFLDTSKPEWKPKELNGYVMPIANELLTELIRANVISNMFFPENAKTATIEFSLQKINLDPVVASFKLRIGKNSLEDSQDTESNTFFTWPEDDAKLSLRSIDGNHFSLEEHGIWAFFRMLQKVNVLVDERDSSSLQILFEVNGNSGRYLLKTENPINPFSPGILTGFNLNQNIA